MFALDNPAVSDGLPAWQAWAAQLEGLAQQYPTDSTIAEARAHAARIIALMTQYPNGLSVRDPRFRAAVRAARMAIPSVASAAVPSLADASHPVDG